VVKQFFRESKWPAGKYAPYQVLILARLRLRLRLGLRLGLRLRLRLRPGLRLRLTKLAPYQVLVDEFFDETTGKTLTG